MSTPPPSGRGLGAGALLVATILVCAALGLALGALTGPTLPLTLAGAAVGFVAGMALVIRTFREP